MKASKVLLLLVVGAAAMSLWKFVTHASPLPTRGIVAAGALGTWRGPTTFNPKESAALFVGIAKFDDNNIHPVQFAVDDAIDLAHEWAFGEHVHLVNPENIVLALSGTIVKDESRERLEHLKATGVKVVEADHDTLLEALDAQAKRVGPGGLLTISFATHGFSRDGVSYVLTQSTHERELNDVVPTATVCEIARTSAKRSLIMFDACRQTLSRNRALENDPATAAPFLDAMNAVEGQVVLYAAAGGRYAYPDMQRKNGVFTLAVLEGLRGQAKADASGLITVQSLHDYVAERVRDWVRDHERDRSIVSATQLNTDGNTARMPLASIRNPPPQLARCVVNPAEATFASGTVTMLDAKRNALGTIHVDGDVFNADTADLDHDACNDVVVAVNGDGADAGRIIAFRGDGTRMWEKSVNVPSAHFRIRDMKIANWRRKNYVVALAVDPDGVSRVMEIEPNGAEQSFTNPGVVEAFQIAKETRISKTKVIIAGTNNHCDPSGTRSFLAMFDVDDVDGEAPTFRGRTRPNTALWYGVLDRGVRLKELKLDDQNADNHLDIHVQTSRGHMALNFDGDVIEGDPMSFTQIRGGRRRR